MQTPTAATSSYQPYFAPTLITAAQEQQAAIYERNKQPGRLAATVRDTYEGSPLVASLKVSLRGLRERNGVHYGVEMDRGHLLLTEYGFRQAAGKGNVRGYSVPIFGDVPAPRQSQGYSGWKKLGAQLPLAKDEAVDTACRQLDSRLAEVAQDVEANAVPLRKGYRGPMHLIPLAGRAFR